MKTIAVVVDERFRAHDTGPMHPERPERLLALERLLAAGRWAELPRIPARPAEEDELARVHTRTHLETVAASARRPHTHFDADTAASAGSFQAALLAAGASIALVDAILDREADAGFAALRPPGHHAEGGHAMGFCLFNNVAVAARHLVARRGLSRVLVLDWDVHHGNGTQHTFYDDPSVFYVSLHQYPFYPGTGAASEIGRGAAARTTLNVPMPAGSGPADYEAAFRELVLPAVRRFEPEFVLVSAGFDAHRDDPLASIRLDEQTFARMTDAVTAVAEESAGGRVALLLEGGYDLHALAASVDAVLARLAEPEPPVLDAGDLGAWGREAREAFNLDSRGRT